MLDVTSTRAPAHEPAVVRWLQGAPVDRARFTDTVARFERAEAHGAGVGVVCLLSSWWYGSAQLVLFAIGGVTLVAARLLFGRTQRPELAAALVFLALELNLAVTVALSGGAHSALLPLLAVPVFSQAVCLRRPVFLVGLGVAAGLAVIAVVAAPLLPAVRTAPPVLDLLGFLALLATLGVAGTALVTSEMSARDEAVVDPMTGLFNRLTLSGRFAEAHRRALATGGSVGLVMLDVDHFKAINDTHGHARGDRVLEQLADRLRGCLRTTDIGYRVGGEEFVVLLPDRDAAAASRVAERIRHSIEAAPLAGLAVTVSAGVVSASGDQDSLAQLLRRADAALYTAKNAGRNQVAAA